MPVEHGKPKYHPGQFKALTFYDRVPLFLSGSDSPRRYLERCLESISERESTVKGWATINAEQARSDADASVQRYRTGKPLSSIDGMVIGIKDLLETKDMPTKMGSRAFENNFPKRDSASVRALRQAGAVILGKTATSELGMSEPAATTNPFDVTRTPGGSSSGSAAAVGAKMVPAAIGTQVGGSIIRPASFCGNYALKPSQGAIHRGERQGQSQSVVGVHAGCLEDLWHVAIETATRCGGDPGYAGLFGPMTLPIARRPECLVVIETQGWSLIDDDCKSVFEQALDLLSACGVSILRRNMHPWVESFEQSIANCKEYSVDLRSFENAWMLENINAEHPGKLSQRVMDLMNVGRSVTLTDYRKCLQLRDDARVKFQELFRLADGVITLASTGIAPVWLGDIEGQSLAPRPTGDISFNAPASALGVPAVSLPLFAVQGMPLGLQVLGPADGDAATIGVSRWINEALTSMTTRGQE